MEDPPDKFDFEHEWPQIAEQVHALLVRCRVPEAIRDDLVQETALRLFYLRGKVDPARSVTGFASTIALNLFRDYLRRQRLAVPVELGPTSEPENIEDEVFARDEWRRVSVAIARLKPAQRAALLAAAGLIEPPAGRSAAAVRVLRMRARRQLRVILDAMSRGRDACGIAIQDMWKTILPIRRAAESKLNSVDQIAQLVSAVIVIATASSLAYPAFSSPSTPWRSATDGPSESSSATLRESGLPPIESERLMLLARAGSWGEQAARLPKRKARTHRLSLGPFGYVEGEDHEVIGIIAKRVSSAEELLNVDANSALEEIGSQRSLVRRQCGLALQRCRSHRNRN